MNATHWSGGDKYQYAEFAASDSRVLDIIARARGSATPLAYWRTVATDLATLVDCLVDERDALWKVLQRLVITHDKPDNYTPDQVMIRVCEARAAIARARNETEAAP